ncbi:MAG: TetR/AcrR family transcriptional regulator [Acidobacteriota bacterium]|nr:TetR/AcrR family transcriptional regulator [Acidobacteriota bacterium]
MKSKKRKGLSRPAGRPLSFDPENALDSALQVFWRKGYEGASLSALTTAMGINRPSLYAAFGDKEALFRKVLDRYAQGPGSHARQALNEPSSRAVVEKLLRGSADLLTAPHGPHGCLLVQGALTCGNSAESMRRELISRRTASESALRQRFKRAKAEGDLPHDAHPANLARYIMTIIHGMSVQAAGGATRHELRRVADLTLQSWPTSV